MEGFKLPELQRKDNGKVMEFDIYLAKEKMIFEYQGEQHYTDIWALGNRWRQRHHDEEKRKACKEHGITLIEIPYWWDLSKSSLIATIHGKRPELIDRGDGNPIPEVPVGGFPSGFCSYLNHSSIQRDCQS